MYTDDPIADFATHDFDQQKALERLPLCCICGEPITDEYAYMLMNDWYHKDCFEQEYEKEVLGEW